MTLLGIVLKGVLDRVTNRDERMFKRFAETELKTHDARLRVAGEWRLKMLERMLDAGGDLRTRLNGIFASLDELSREASLNGATEDTTVLVKKCDAAIRNVNGVGGYVPLDLVRRTVPLLARFDAVVHEIVRWSNLSEKSDRTAGCDATNATIRTIAEDMTATFVTWHEGMWNAQETYLGTLGSSGDAGLKVLIEDPAVPKVLPSPPPKS